MKDDPISDPAATKGSGGRDYSYDAVDKCSPKQQICDNVSISFMVRKNWAYTPTANGSYGRLAGCKAGRLAGCQTKSGWIREDLKNLYR